MRGPSRRCGLGRHCLGRAGGTHPDQAVSAHADQPAPSTTLTVEDLCVHYGQAMAVSKTSFTIQRGHALAILGPNGAG